MSTQTLSSTFPRSRTATDRQFYLVMAVASAVLIFTGFARSYYLRSYFPQTGELSLLIHVHGLVNTAWMLYFVLQAALIAVRRPELHRRLGITGAVLGSAVILLGLAVAFAGMRLHHGTATQDAEVIFLIGLIDVFTFAMFFILGYLKRRDRETHQRAMLLAVIAGLTGAAIGRLLTFGLPIPVLSLINFAFLFAGPVYDFVTRRRVHRVYVFGVLFAVATFTPLRFVVGATPWWHRMAHLIAGV